MHTHAAVGRARPSRARRIAWLALLASASVLPLAVAQPSSDLAVMATAVGSEEARRATGGLATRADCTGPRGPFTTEIVHWGDDVRLVQAREQQRIELLLSGGRVFSRPDPAGPLAHAEDRLAAFVHGHAIHRLLLDLDRLAVVAGGPLVSGCVELDSRAGPLRVCRREPDARPAWLDLQVPGTRGPEPVRVELSDWRPVMGLSLPYRVDYLHGGERYTHRFRHVLPFRPARGVSLPAAPDARFDRLGDVAGILALHLDAIEAHRAGDVERLVAGEAEWATISRRGELVETPKATVRERFAAYLAATRFTRYEDVAIPIVAVSADGSLGWLACQIDAAGDQRDAAGALRPIAYGFSWVELTARRDGRWERIGNASSPRP